VNKLITFEGIDGSGKSTQIKMLLQKFDSLGIEYVAVREPGGNRISEIIRDILLQKENLELSPVSESLLFQSARAQLVDEVILPSLQLGKFVICDRYTDSSLAYQGYGRGIDLNTIATLNTYATQGTLPGLTFIIDVDIQTSLERRCVAAADRMESGGPEFLERVRQGYLELARSHPRRYQLLDGTLAADRLFNEIWNILQENFVGVL